jgi:Na+/melibiose symporter-like transporter
VPRRLVWSLLAASLALNAMYGAIAGILVPAQIAAADPAGRELTLGLVMAASSAVTLLVHPLAGAVSDRTRTRWGRRTPWIVGGAAAAGAAMLLLGRADTVLAIALGWLVLQPLLNVVEAPLDAVLADRVPPGRRPRVSAAIGAGAASGLALGAVLAGLGLRDVAGVYAALAVVFVVVMIGFALVSPDSASAGLPTPSNGLRFRDAWRSPGLRRVFTARLVLVLGHQLVIGYLLYIVMAFTGDDVQEAGARTSLLLGVHIGCIVVAAIVGAAAIRSRRVPWVIAGTLIVAAGLVVPLAWPSGTGLAVYAGIAGIGRGLYLAADLALMVDVLPSRADSGRDLGVLALATILPQTLAPALAAVVLALSGNAYALLFGVALVGVLASVPIVAGVREREPSRP